MSPNRLELNEEGHTPSTATGSFDETDHSDEEYIDSVEVRYFDTIDVSFLFSLITHSVSRSYHLHHFER